MTSADIAPCFTRPDGSYFCARWGRPIVPVVFGLQDNSLPIVKGAIEAVIALAGHEMAETDPELGANLMLFFLRDWADMANTPALDGLIEGVGPLAARLQAQQANQYRMFRFDRTGAIMAVFCFLRMDDALLETPAEDLALDQAARVMLTWAEGAFHALPTLAQVQGNVVLNPKVAAIIRAAYQPAMPVVAQDAAHALRIAARVAV